MNRVFAIMLMLAIAGCAGTPREEDPGVVAIQDFIAVGELEPAKRIRTEMRNNYDVVNKRYLILESPHNTYLVEFQRNCTKLYSNHDAEADRRWNGRYLWPKADRIRGCLIGRIFEISEAEEAEIRAMGDAPRGITVLR